LAEPTPKAKAKAKCPIGGAETHEHTQEAAAQRDAERKAGEEERRNHS
jgi:hypothetical protein